MDIFAKIKNFVTSHKKASIAVLVLTVVSAICIRSYVLSINKKTVNTEKVTETAKKDSTVKKDDTKKSDENKSDTKKDEKKSDVNENKTTTDTTVAEDSKTVENKTTENTSTNVTNNTSSNTVSQPTSTPCIPTYTTVNHPEQGHYDTHVVQEAWDDPQFDTALVGLTSGHIYSSVDDFIENSDLYGDGNYASKTIQVGTVHHDAVTTQVWVVDQAAWTETVASGC